MQEAKISIYPYTKTTISKILSEIFIKTSWLLKALPFRSTGDSKSRIKHKQSAVGVATSIT